MSGIVPKWFVAVKEDKFYEGATKMGEPKKQTEPIIGKSDEDGNGGIGI